MKYDQKKAKKVLQLPVNSLEVPELQLPIKLDGKLTVYFEIETGAGESFIGKNTWHKIGKPTLEEPIQHFESASVTGTKAEITCYSEKYISFVNKNKLYNHRSTLPSLSHFSRSYKVHVI